MSILEVMKAILRGKLLMMALLHGIALVLLFHTFFDFMMNHTNRELSGKAIENLMFIRTSSYAFYVGIMVAHIWAPLANGYTHTFLRRTNILQFVFSYLITICIPLFLMITFYTIKYNNSAIYCTASLLVVGFSLFFTYVTALFSRYDYRLDNSIYTFSSKISYTFIPAMVLIFLKEDFFNTVAKSLEYFFPGKAGAFLFVSLVLMGATVFQILNTPKYVRRSKYTIIDKLK